MPRKCFITYIYFDVFSQPLRRTHTESYACSSHRSSKAIASNNAAFSHLFRRRRRKSSLARRRRRQRDLSRVRWGLHVQQQTPPPSCPNRKLWRCALCSYCDRINQLIRARSRSRVIKNQTHRPPQYAKQGTIASSITQKASRRWYICSIQRSCGKQLRPQVSKFWPILSRRCAQHRWPWIPPYTRIISSKEEGSPFQGRPSRIVRSLGFRPANTRQRGNHVATVTISSPIAILSRRWIKRPPPTCQGQRPKEIKYQDLKAGTKIPGQRYNHQEERRHEEACLSQRRYRTRP